MPQIIAAENERITSPPRKNNASSAKNTVVAVIIVRGKSIEREDLREEVLNPQRAPAQVGGQKVATQIDLSRGISFYDEVNRFQIELIRRALEITGGHQSRAAKLLGMNTTTLNSKIRYYNIRP